MQIKDFVKMFYKNKNIPDNDLRKGAIIADLIDFLHQKENLTPSINDLKTVKRVALILGISEDDVVSYYNYWKNAYN